MVAGSTTGGHDGMTLRRAAVVAGLAYLLNPVSYAEFSIFPKLVVADAAQTVQNITAHPGLFVAAILCYLFSFMGDVVLAWALYILLAPVNRGLSLLSAWFQLVYAGISCCALLNLVSVSHLVRMPEYAKLFGAGPLEAQVQFLLHSFHWGWSLALVLFAAHLVLLGVLVYRSGYIPRLLGVLLVVNGLGWAVDGLGPYVLPNASFGWDFVTFFGEIFFMLWLLIRGWKVSEPATRSQAGRTG